MDHEVDADGEDVSARPLLTRRLTVSRSLVARPQSASDMGSNLVRPRGCQVGTQGSTPNVSLFQRASCLLISAGARESTHPSNAFSDDVNKFNRTANQRRRSTGANEGVALVGREPSAEALAPMLVRRRPARDFVTCRERAIVRRGPINRPVLHVPDRGDGSRIEPNFKNLQPGLSNHQGVHLSRPHARFTRAPSNSVIRKPPEFNLQDKRRR
jgi:hypothetical protein